MSAEHHSIIPLACVPGAVPPEERAAHVALVQRLFRQDARERLSLPDGYAYRFAPDAFADVARFVANERHCCPFLTFTLEMTAGGGALWLRLTGPAGATAVIDAEFPPWTAR